MGKTSAKATLYPARRQDNFRKIQKSVFESASGFLVLNPGYSSLDLYLQHNDPSYIKEMTDSYLFANKVNFFLLDKKFDYTGGYQWWYKRLKNIIGEVGHVTVANRISCVQYFPYHSESYCHCPEVVPSQNYSFWLVKQAIKLGKIIVIMWGEKYWIEAVPELKEYNYIRLNGRRATYISPGNMKPSDYIKLMTLLKNKQ
jgi:hypothetical protein